MNLTLTERDKKLLGLTACLAILAVFGVHLILSLIHISLPRLRTSRSAIARYPAIVSFRQAAQNSCCLLYTSRCV